MSDELDFNELDDLNTLIRGFFAYQLRDPDEMDAQYDAAKAAIERLGELAEQEYLRRQERTS